MEVHFRNGVKGATVESVTFPNDSIGEFVWSGDEQRGSRFEARGEIQVLPGKRMVLWLSERATGTLSAIRLSAEGLMSAVTATDIGLKDEDLYTLSTWMPRKIILRNVVVTNEGVGHFSRAKSLRFLSLKGCPVTNVVSDAIGQLTGLNRLYFTNTQVSELRPLHQLSELHTLGLANAPVSDRDAEALRSLGGLKRLTLSGTLVTSAALHALAELRALEWLLLDDTKVDDENIEILAGLPSLQTLDLSGTAISTAAIGKLLPSPSLSQLRFNGTAVDDEVAEVLAVMKTLKEIDFEGSSVSETAENLIRRALPEAIINGVRRS